MNILYSVSCCRKDDSLYGKIHASTDSNTTLCGVEIDENWWVLGHEGEGLSCKECLKLLDTVKYKV